MNLCGRAQGAMWPSLCTNLAFEEVRESEYIRVQH